MKTKKTMDEWLNEEDQWPTATESAQHEAARKAMEGTWLETITMLANGELQIATWQYMPGGVQAEGYTESAPGDPGYDDFILRHGPLKPGQSHTLAHKWADGKWIVQEDNCSS